LSAEVEAVASAKAAGDSAEVGVLKSMPESARNRYLDNPEFTRGMNDEDRDTLRDLSNLHVGGSPDPPSE